MEISMNAATGLLDLIYVTAEGCYCSLDPSTTPKPKDDLFWLDKDHGNYDSIYALLLACYMGNVRITLRVHADITGNEYGKIVYVKCSK
jgi:hypothetical protein